MNTALLIRRNKDKYTIDPCEEETLTRKQLTHFLYRLMGIQPEEMAFMFVEFTERPDKTEAHFGIRGMFLFAK